MNSADAIKTLSALGQATRLDAFGLLVRAGQDGLGASNIANALCVPRNTMSSHLSQLTNAGLTTATRNGKQVIYRADLLRLNSLTAFLVEGCCGGHQELCEPLISDLQNMTSG